MKREKRKERNEKENKGKEGFCLSMSWKPRQAKLTLFHNAL